MHTPEELEAHQEAEDRRRLDAIDAFQRACADFMHLEAKHRGLNFCDVHLALEEMCCRMILGQATYHERTVEEEIAKHNDYIRKMAEHYLSTERIANLISDMVTRHKKGALNDQ